MANTLYPKWKEAILNGGSNVALNGTVKVSLIDTADESYNAADQYYSDLTAGGIVATTTLSTGKTYTGGLFDADDVTFSSVTGDQSEALVIWIDTGSGSTSRLVAWIDTGVTGLPVTPNGGNIVVSWNASGIFQL